MWFDGKNHLCIFLVCYRLTKPLSFADCVGDELPWGWEAGFDPQIGVYYIDHVNSKFFCLVEQIYQKSNLPKSRVIQKSKHFISIFLYFKPYFLRD